MRATFATAAVCCLIMFTACGTKQVNLADQASDVSLRTVYLREVEYDRQGLPLFVKTLDKRPVKPGERFTIAQFRSNLPVKTYDIAIKRPHGDLSSPLHIVYHWTEEGFKAGAALGLVMAGALLDASDGQNDAGDLGLAAGVVVVPAVIGTAGGFVVGLAESAPSGWAETEKIMLRGQESIVTYTEYDCNDLRQLRHMTMYEPDTKEPIVRTDFYYEDDRTIPTETYIRSYRENKVRVIDRQGTREVGGVTQ